MTATRSASVSASIPNVVFGVTPRFSGFRFATGGNGQLIFVDGPSAYGSMSTAIVSPYIELYSDASASGADVDLYSTTTLYATPDLALSWQFDVFLGFGAGLSSCELFCGLIPATTATGPISVALPTGVGFIKRTTDTVWNRYTKAAGGVATPGSLTVAIAAGTRYQFRLELTGANSSDSAVAQAIFYINGVKQGQIAVDILGPIQPYFRLTRVAAGSGDGIMFVGPNQFRATLP